MNGDFFFCSSHSHTPSRMISLIEKKSYRTFPPTPIRGGASKFSFIENYVNIEIFKLMVGEGLKLRMVFLKSCGPFFDNVLPLIIRNKSFFKPTNKSSVFFSYLKSWSKPLQIP